MSARVLERGATVPLWEQLQHDLAARVKAGEFTDLFPSETALTEEYKVSRQTVRQALRDLRTGGVVTGARGRPSRVAPPAEIDQPLGALYSLFATIEAAGLSPFSKVRTFEIQADGVVAARLRLEESTPLVYLHRLWSAGERPLALDRIWMPAHLAAPVLGADLAKADFYQHLAERAGVRLESGHEDIYAVTPTDIQRRQLGCPPGCGAFAIRRLGRVRGVPAEWRQILVRGDRFPLTGEFAARTGYRLAAPTAAPPH